MQNWNVSKPEDLNLEIILEFGKDLLLKTWLKLIIVCKIKWWINFRPLTSIILLSLLSKCYKYRSNYFKRMKCCVNLTPSNWEVSLLSKTVYWRIYWYCREKSHIKQFLSVRVWEWKSKSRHTMHEREIQIFKSEIYEKKKKEHEDAMILFKLRGSWKAT